MSTDAAQEKLDGLISYLNNKAYALECCDTTNTYAEALAIRRWIKQLSSLSEIGAHQSATGETWRPMMSAPLDGTEIEILFEHFDYWTCLKLKGKEQADKEYRAAQRAHWIDHNGGGWTWHGMAGSPVGWRPLSATDSGSA